MWLRTGQLISKRKKVIRLFEDDFSNYPEQIKVAANKFIKIMNDLTTKYPQILLQADLLPVSVVCAFIIY